MKQNNKLCYNIKQYYGWKKDPSGGMGYNRIKVNETFVALKMNFEVSNLIIGTNYKLLFQVTFIWYVFFTLFIS